MFIGSIECKKFVLIVGYKKSVDNFIKTKIIGNHSPEMYVVVYLLKQEISSKLSFYVTAYPEQVRGEGKKLMQYIISDYIAALVSK